MSVSDGVQALRAAADLSNVCSLEACDLDGTGTITITDGVNVLRAAADLPNPCPPPSNPILDTGEWVVERLSACIPEEPFAVRIDGAYAGTTKLLAIGNRAGESNRYPQVLVVNASGYLRLKAGADPEAGPLPFGQSLVLGPGVVGSTTSAGEVASYLHPQLTQVDVDTSSLDTEGRGALLLRLAARALPADVGAVDVANRILDLDWTIVVADPTEERTHIDVVGTYRFAGPFTFDADATTRDESFRLVQIASLFIDDARHDVDVLRFSGNGAPVTIAYAPDLIEALLPLTPIPLSTGGQLDSLHTDDQGLPNGNTPSYRIEVSESTGPLGGSQVPRAFITATQSVDDDNLGVWIHQDPTGPVEPGAGGRTHYSVIATTDPLPAP